MRSLQQRLERYQPCCAVARAAVHRDLCENDVQSLLSREFPHMELIVRADLLCGYYEVEMPPFFLEFDLLNLDYLSRRFGNGSRTMAARTEALNADSRFNFTISQRSSRPSSGYFSSQHSTQPTVTESQINLSQTSVQSEPGINSITRVESLAGILTEVMEQRLLALDNSLNGIFGGLDGLQKNLCNVQTSIKEAAVESDINRQKEAVRQHHLQQTLVDQSEDIRRNFVVMKTIPETVREEMKKIQIEELSDAVKKIPGQIAEQIAEMKAEVLRTMKKEFQVAITNWRRTEPQDPPRVRELSINSFTGGSENSTESDQAICREAHTRTREVLSQKVLRGPTANERQLPYEARKQIRARHCKEDPRSKRALRAKKSTTYPRTSNSQPSKENVRLVYAREEGGTSEVPKAHGRRRPETLAVSGISGFKSKDPPQRRTLSQMPSEAGWVTVRRSENKNQPLLLEANTVSGSPLTNPDRDIPTQTLLQKASNSDTQCEPVAEHIINTEEYHTNPLVYLGSKAAGNKDRPAQVIELSEDSLDETRLVRQRLRARRRRFHCL
ncbi:hypothetical protein R1flu_010698 [Riccia fluitans]|uniref:Uncharacterized protein n=1 Tax=Riccia fluitans TaxID=41844 RepID=A0ABD1Z618_9MARC